MSDHPIKAIMNKLPPGTIVEVPGGYHNLDLGKEGKKDDSSKLRHDLLPVPVLEEVSKVLTFGASKYGDRNWEAGISFSRVYAACLRHLFSWWSRESRDKETNLNHLAHAICCLMFLLQYEQFPSKYKSFDDRPELWK